MDINRVSFWPRLLYILEVLSKSHFVALDFELSGVSSRPAAGRQKQTLQERYEETKQSAERYQILQIGLTCVEQNTNHDAAEAYVVRTFNIPLNPCFEEDLDLERIFSYQSGAVDFLTKNGYSMAEPFVWGVPYLSRDEEQAAKQKAKRRHDKRRFESVQLPEDDVESVKFLDKVRSEIREWQRTGKPHNDELVITSRTLTWDKASVSNLSSFDRLLVHQLVRAEFPDLITIGRSVCVSIKHLDEEREARYRKDFQKKMHAKIAKQTGFRWVIEALSGSRLQDKIDLTWFAKDSQTGADLFFDKDDLSARFNRYATALRTRRPVLVGHNLFTDLVYLYQCFIGTLPDTVSEFRIRIHDLFPVIVDTKYMATHNCGNLNPKSSLEEIEQALRNQQIPRISMHPSHRKYDDKEAFHEAGYDSLLTARVMILLSANLEAAGTYVVPFPSPNILSGDEGYDTALEDPYESPEETPVAETTQPKDIPTGPKKKPGKRKSSPTSRFATGGMFDILATSVSRESSPEPQASGSFKVSKPSSLPFHGKKSSLNPTAHSFGAPSSLQQLELKQGKERKVESLMPPFESDFWRVYANKLRIFGTEEKILDLDPLRMN